MSDRTPTQLTAARLQWLEQFVQTEVATKPSARLGSYHTDTEERIVLIATSPSGGWQLVDRGRTGSEVSETLGNELGEAIRGALGHLQERRISTTRARALRIAGKVARRRAALIEARVPTETEGRRAA